MHKQIVCKGTSPAEPAFYGLYRGLQMFYRFSLQTVPKTSKTIHLVTNENGIYIAMKAPQPSIQSASTVKTEFDYLKELGFEIKIHYIRSTRWYGV